MCDRRHGIELCGVKNSNYLSVLGQIRTSPDHIDLALKSRAFDALMNAFLQTGGPGARAEVDSCLIQRATSIAESSLI